MNAPQIYVGITIMVLGIIALLVVFIFKKGKKEKLTPLTGLAFGFVLAGIFSITIFGGNRLIVYSLMGIGVVLAVIDMIKKLKK